MPTQLDVLCPQYGSSMSLRERVQKRILPEPSIYARVRHLRKEFMFGRYLLGVRRIQSPRPFPGLTEQFSVNCPKNPPT